MGETKLPGAVLKVTGALLGADAGLVAHVVDGDVAHVALPGCGFENDLRTAEEGRRPSLRAPYKLLMRFHDQLVVGFEELGRLANTPVIFTISRPGVRMF